MPGDVDVGGPEASTASRAASAGGSGWRRRTRRAALAGALAVELDEARREARRTARTRRSRPRARPPRPRPRRPAIDVRRSAAKRPSPLQNVRRVTRLAEARERVDPQPHPAHDPHPALVEARRRAGRRRRRPEASARSRRGAPARRRSRRRSRASGCARTPGPSAGSATSSAGSNAARALASISLGEVARAAPAGDRGPCPSIISSRAPGIALAVCRPAAGRTSGSAVPWMTSAGRSSRRRRGVRLPEQLIACSWRATPAGAEAAVVGAADELAKARLVHRVGGRADQLEASSPPASM